MKNLRNILWGIVLIVLGLIMGANSLGIVNVDLFFAGWWTLFIIVPCVIGLITEKDKAGYIVGIVVGVILLLSIQNVISTDMIWKLALPVILIIVGISFFFKNKDNSNNDENK